MCKEKLEGMGDQGRRQGRQCVWAWETEEGYETARSSHGEGQELPLPPLGPLGRVPVLAGSSWLHTRPVSL